MRYVIGLGSNCEPRETHLINALNSLATLADSIYSSTHYESPALGASGKPHYLNAVAEIESSLPIYLLNARLKEIETAEGRDEEARAEGRVPLDADIVIAGDEIIRPKDFKQFFFRRGYEELRSDFEKV
ncbi:MAG: 2-amino-4-hydroxy-6-hydroxymethyldihydropteridine diphosphokinase [Muribaculaceae bacterium]|nr:2-amino-4-hydroxy-6-hydroxymethyldihydropteridine diphosphokinase [Bacteroidales bacterium]MDE6234132.1 2-amino-4-hydroxy-6-hydroxymethyldihydropteridine diphosphokinase [Muribaculaceae bacterium]